MIPSTVSLTINIRFIAAAILVSSTVLLFSSWAKVSNSSTLNILAGEAAFKTAITEHVTSVNNKKLNYDATAGYLLLRDALDKPQANIFYTAYTLNNHAAANRPVTFLFNGGPGSASIWLHMGAFGPVRVGSNGKIADNPSSWLEFTDLVFVDPVGTGYSRPADGVNARQFFGYQEDIRAMAKFVDDYIAANNRQASPKFLAGESYGGLRAIGLAQQLEKNHKIKLNGITLISPALNYQLISFKPGNESAYSNYLPSYAVTAQFHKCLDSELISLSPEQLMTKAAGFAQGSYQTFLSQGDAVSNTFRERIIDSLSYFTGLNKAYISQLNGRITDQQFVNGLLKARKAMLGTFDGRIKGVEKGQDPSVCAVKQLYTNAFNTYIANTLHYQNKLPYLATTATGEWNYGSQANNRYAEASSTLRHVMTANPGLKINIVGGYYDLATPVATTTYVVNHLGISRELSKNITLNFYPAGHMIYTNDTVNISFKNTSRLFYENALAAFAQKG